MRHGGDPREASNSAEGANPPYTSPVRRATLLVPPLTLLLAGCGAGTVDTAGLTQVRISTSQALPPPYGQHQTTLTSAASLAQFAKLISDNHIGVGSTTGSSGGCSGGIQYTIVVVARSGTTDLSAYDCANQITGNMSGNVSGFISGLEAAGWP